MRFPSRGDTIRNCASKRTYRVVESSAYEDGRRYCLIQDGGFDRVLEENAFASSALVPALYEVVGSEGRSSVESP